VLGTRLVGHLDTYLARAHALERAHRLLHEFLRVSYHEDSTLALDHGSGDVGEGHGLAEARRHYHQ
jgi:hypothetical protein